MTTIKNLGANKTELWKDNGVVFFSYETPVAAKIEGKLYRTSKKYSVTTSKHINAWLEHRHADEKPQEFFDSLV
jgi:hypothetical protein